MYIYQEFGHCTLTWQKFTVLFLRDQKCSQESDQSQMVTILCVTQSDSSSVRVADPGVVRGTAHAAGHVDLLRLEVELGVADVGVPENKASRI